MEVLLVVAGIGVVVALLKSTKPAPAPRAVAIAQPVLVTRVPAVRVLGGLVATTLIYALYAAAAALYLSTHPPFLVEWWFLMIFADIAALIVAADIAMPKAYRDYAKSKPKHAAHSVADYLVGLVLSVSLLAALGLHVVVLASAPQWQVL